MDISELDVNSSTANRNLNTVFGKYTAFGVTCTEMPVNNVVARVHVERLCFNENKSTSDLPQSKMIGRKRMLDDSDSDQEDTSVNVENHVRKRGRPRKQRIIINSDDTENTSANLTPFISVKSVEKLQCLNGDDSNDAKCTSGRVRKPNSKFQDYVVSPNSRHNSTSSPEMNLKEKSKELVDIPDITNEEDDPLAIPSEVVHSFLPVFDSPPKFGNTIVLKSSDVTVNKKFKEKENHAAEQKTITVTAECPTVTESSGDAEILTKVKKSPTITPVKSTIVTLAPTTEKNEKDSPPASTQKKLKFEKSLEYKVSFESLKNQVKTKVEINNGSKTIAKQENSTYALVESVNTNNRTKTSKPNEVDFNKLVRCLKSIKLPANNWKIRIVVSRQQTITEVAFTNKEANERCVKFSRNYSGYIITFGKSAVKLHGAPNKISSFNDVTILLDIIHNISLNDQVLEFSNKSLK